MIFAGKSDSLYPLKQLMKKYQSHSDDYNSFFKHFLRQL